MEAKDLPALIISLLSFCLAGYALYKTTKHNSQLRAHNDQLRAHNDQMRAYQAEMRQYASTAPEFGIANLIKDARAALAANSLRRADIRKGKPDEKLTPTERQKLKDLDPAYFEACEALLNAYDRACILYRDGILNRDRFLRLYEVEIRELFGDSTDYYKKRLNDMSSPYNALKAVYVEWFNREK